MKPVRIWDYNFVRHTVIHNNEMVQLNINDNDLYRVLGYISMEYADMLGDHCWKIGLRNYVNLMIDDKYFISRRKTAFFSRLIKKITMLSKLHDMKWYSDKVPVWLSSRVDNLGSDLEDAYDIISINRLIHKHSYRVR